MQVRDLMQPDGRVFLKSEWGPISDRWPCVSFTKKSVGDHLRAEFRPGRDVLIYVGTTSAETTEDPRHRGRLISAVVVQPNQVLETKKIVPPDAWRDAVARWGERWPLAMAVIRAADIIGDPLPHAHDVILDAYRSFSEFANRGRVVEAQGAERAAVMDLDIREIRLQLSEDVRRYLKMMQAVAPDLGLAIKQEITRMALRIEERVSRSGLPSIRTNPARSAPNISDLVGVLTAKWKNQHGSCSLCGGHLVPMSTNSMLQPSADRIDSANASYREDNLQITHLACNWAKNQYGGSQFLEWLDIVRGEDTPDQSTEA